MPKRVIKIPKPRPKTGEPRVTRQPLKIDLLPQDAREAIETLYDRGRTWLEIEVKSAQAYSANWEKDEGGFVNWEALDLKVLEQFPNMRLPKSSLQRWFDLRVRQARAQVLKESAQAREFAAAWAGKSLPDSNAAVINALRDLVFGLMQDSGAVDKMKLLGGLQDLTLAMSRMQRVEIQERRVAVDERKMKALEEREAIARRKLEAEADKATTKLRKGELKPEDLAELVQRTFGIAPGAAHA